MTNNRDNLKISKKQARKIWIDACLHAKELESNSMFSSNPEVRAKVFKQEFMRYLFGK